MLSIRLRVSANYNPADVSMFYQVLGRIEDPYPDYELQIADDMKFISTPEEFKLCLSEVMKYADQFEVIYLGKVGEQARLIKLSTHKSKRSSILQPAFFVKQPTNVHKKSKQSTAIIKYKRRQDSNAVVYGGLIFLIALGVTFMYLSRRDKRQTD